MTTETLRTAMRPARKRARRGTRVWLLAIGTACLAWMTCTIRAEMIDDFEDPAHTDQVWTKPCFFGSCSHDVADGQLRLAITPAGDHGFSVLRSVDRWTLRERRTLEFRVDLIRSSGDGAVARLGFGYGDGAQGYIMAFDQDTIALGKRDNPFQLFLLSNGVPIKATNVKLVLSVTGGPEGAVLLQVRILDNEQGGRVLYSSPPIWDTAGADPMVLGSDDPPGSYLGVNGIFHLSLYHDNAALYDPTVEIARLSEAELILDNAEVIEYDSAWIAPPSNALLLSWPENTAEEQIVVGAAAVEGPYTPWPEPIFKRLGEICMAVLTTPAHQFFTLVPGTQFIDDFDALKQPFATRNSWAPNFYAPADASRFVITNVDGALRIRTVSSAADGRVALVPPGTNVMVRDFCASVDILAWPVAGKLVAIFARGVLDRPPNWPGATDGYLGIVNRVHNDLRIWGSDGGPTVGPEVTIDPAAHYRLGFSGSGTRLSQRLENLTTGAVSEWSTVRNQWSQGPVCLWVEAGAGGSIDITLDNFFVTGTKP